MERKDFTIESQFDGLEIKVVMMVPDTPIRGVVQFAHGMAEHKERYFDFMKYLVAAGFVTVIHDHRGHGESLRSQEDLRQQEVPRAGDQNALAQMCCG